MPCCIIAATLIVRILINWKDLKVYFGFKVTDDNPYGWTEFTELDQFAN